MKKIYATLQTKGYPLDAVWIHKSSQDDPVLEFYAARNKTNTERINPFRSVFGRMLKPVQIPVLTANFLFQ